MLTGLLCFMGASGPGAIVTEKEVTLLQLLLNLQVCLPQRLLRQLPTCVAAKKLMNCFEGLPCACSSLLLLC